MLKNIISTLPITTLIISFLFMCGGLFLIGYWSTFDVDPFSIIQIWDIPKNFIYPVMISGGLGMVVMVIYLLIFTKEQLFHQVNRSYKTRVIYTSIFFIGLVAFILLRHHLKYEWYFWAISTVLLGVLTIMEILFLPFVNNIISSRKLRVLSVSILVFSPILSFTFGKKQSLIIYQNESINSIAIKAKDIQNTINCSCTLKLLGFLGDKFIIGTLDNKKIYVLNQSAFDVIELEKIKEK